MDLVKSSKVPSNILWGLRYTFSFALVCGVLAAIPWLFGGPDVFNGDFTLWQLLVSYVALAMASGIVVGLFRPIASSYPGAAVLGVVLGWLMAGEVRSLVIGFSPPQFFDGFLLVFLGIAGGITGIACRYQIIRIDRTRSSLPT